MQPPDSQVTSSAPAPASISPRYGTDTDRPRRATLRSSLVSVAVLGSFALVPFVLLRARYRSLQANIGSITAAQTALRRELQVLNAGALTRLKEHQQLVGLLEETKKGFEGLKTHAEEQDRIRAEADAKIHAELSGMKQAVDRMQADAVQRYRAQAEWAIAHQGKLQSLLKEYQQSRAYLSGVRDLGPALAHIAAFMQEVELRQGYVPRKNDGRGIDRIRQLARILEELPKYTESNEKSSKSCKST